MHPYVIHKQPGTTILYLFFIMLLFIVKETCGTAQCNKACFGPVWKMQIYNELSGGYLHVMGNQVVANSTINTVLYKISKKDSLNFYLFDANAEKFICWNMSKRSNLVARKYKQSTMAACQFRDGVADENLHSTHIHLLGFGNGDRKLRFNKHGRFTKKPCGQRKTSRSRHRHLTPERCLAKSAAFLTIPVENPTSKDGDICGCPEARDIFCRSKLRRMGELRSICSLLRSNETYL